MLSNNAARLDDDSESDFPSVGGRLPNGEMDFCSREGAHALKAKIEAYWSERDRNVMVMLQNVGFHPAIRAARYDLRSDMVNGLPRATRKSAPPMVEAVVDVLIEDSDDIL